MSYVLRFAIILSILLVAGCASREAGWTKKSQQVTLGKSEMKVLKKEALTHWKQRMIQENLEEALSKFELIHAANPKDLDALVYLTRGYYLLADAHLENPDLKKRNFEKGTSFGEMAMATNDMFREKMTEGKAVEEALDYLTKKEIAAIYWTAASLGKWAKSAGIATQLKYKTRIKAMIEQVERLDPNFFHGAPSRFWGAYYALAPAFAGGDMGKSKTHFEKSLKAAPEYLGTQVLMAEVYWTKKGDKKAFESMLGDVLRSTQDKHPELGPENILEKKKAQKLLANMNDLF